MAIRAKLSAMRQVHARIVPKNSILKRCGSLRKIESANIGSSETGTVICHKEKPYGNLSCGKFLPDPRYMFYVYGCATL
jgi:hypothetical protein